jgi:hypothetical protein
VHSRHNETLSLWFRCDRFYRCNERWYFHTREDIPVGPYNSRAEAGADADLLVAVLKYTPHEQSHRVIRDFLMRSGGDLDILNDPAFTSYVTSEGSTGLSRRTG